MICDFFRYWLFGERIEENKCRSSKDRVRGWFPRNAATELAGELDDLYESYEQQVDTKKDK